VSTAATLQSLVERPAPRRRVDCRLVSGVAGGLADSLNAPAWLVRIVFLSIGSLIPWSLFAYVGATLLVPARGQRRPGWDNLLCLGWLAVLFLPSRVFGPGLSINEDLLSESPAEWVPVLALALVFITLLLSRNYPHGPSPAQARAAVLSAAAVLLFPALIALGMVLAPDLRWDRAVPVAVILGGVGLLAAVRRGSWRPLIAPVVVTAIVAAYLVATDVRLQGGIGDRVVTASATGGPPATERVAVGDLTLNLARLRPSSDPVTVRASVGMGKLRVIAPRRASVAVDLRVGSGQVYVERMRSGLGLSAHSAHPRLRPFTPAHPNLRLRVVAEVGVGSIEVYRKGAGSAIW
jgi:phage shock protein PspC (stress-responsive transcriptional regulator)